MKCGLIFSQSTQKHPAETTGLVEDNFDKRGGKTNNSTSLGAPESDARDNKRRKKSNHGSFDTDMKSNGCTQPNVLQSEFVATSKLESQLGELSGEKPLKILDSRDKKRGRCAFCQTADLTDVSFHLSTFLLFHSFTDKIYFSDL